MNDLASMFVPTPKPNPMRPIAQAAPGWAIDPWGNPIDLNRPRLQNPDGSVSTELTATSQFTTPQGPRWINFPTIVGGKRLTLDQAVQALLAGQNQPTGVYERLPDAEAAAQARTGYLGYLLGGGD